MVPVREIERFAEASGIEVRWPLDVLFAPRVWNREQLLEDRTAEFDVRTNPCVDFGRYQECIPRCVFAPRNETQLQEVLRFLFSIRLPYKLRGGGHSSGGQTLIKDGAVVDLRKLAFIEDEAGELVTVGGGAWWLELVEYLAPKHRRPQVLTDNLRSTVGGTLAVGGFGDTSHVFGLQIDSVERFELVTPEGALRRVDRTSDLFGLVLAGRGQLGAIASATLRTLHRPPLLAARLLVWERIADFLAEDLRAFEYLRARRFWNPDRIEAIAGSFGDPKDAALSDVKHARISTSWEMIDLLSTYRADPSADWTEATPAVEFTLPLEAALDALRVIDGVLTEHELLPHLVDGASISIVPPSPLPLAPLAPSGPSLLIALRPKMKPSQARAKLGPLRQIGALALARGGKLYAMSVEPAPFDLSLEYGAALDALRASKDLLDPDHLSNPGLLPRM